ncbi:inositol monophosphatase 1-like isoform X2 [Linepithema humile]|uniref:inositol monophosphatase 1-like isoform X2 n=1 Tax=Linepithema humile TaxID=83485 RepID=UPI00351F7156
MLRFFHPRYLRNNVLLVSEIRGGNHAVCTANQSFVPTRPSTSAVMSSDLDITKCFEFAKELTLQAGKLLKCGFEAEKIVERKEAEWDFVTDFDQRIEKMFIDGLSEEFPDHIIVAEEAAGATGKVPELTDAPTWLIDPIDGTLNFVHTFPHACISVGLTVRKEPVLGIVYNPMNSELYTAIKELKNAVQAFEMTGSKHKDIYMGRLEALLGATQATRSVGSAALDMAYVARGAVDCFHMDGLKVWDVAAGTLIVREAGGTVIDTKGGVYNIMKPNTVAAANETLAREMSKLIVDTDLKTQRRRLKRT